MKSLGFFNKVTKHRLFKILLIAVLVICGYETTRLVVVALYHKIRQTFFSEDADFRPLTVETEAARRGSIVRSITLPGRLVANQKVTLRPELEAKLKAVLFEGGQAVQKGAALYQLDDHIFKAQLKEAKAKLVLAQQELERASRLAEKSAGTLKQKEKAQADFLEAEASVEINQHRVNNTVIRAPFDGYIGINHVSVGSFVNQQTELATIVDSDPMKIDFRIPARYMKQISVGQRIQVAVDGLDGQELEAKIVNVDARVEDNVHSAVVRAAINNPRNFLKAGVFARVKVVVGSKNDVLLVPRDAVKSSSDEEYVFRIYKAQLQNGKMQMVALKTPIVTGLESGETVEVTRGLKEGTQVITIGLDKIRNGFPVTIVQDQDSDSAKPASSEDEEELEEADLDDELDDEEDDDENDALLSNESPENSRSVSSSASR